jgi:septum formation inhibitor MinC
MDFIFNAGNGIAETFTGQKVPGHFKNGKLILDREALAQSGRGWNSFVKGLSRGTGVTIIPQAGRGVKCVKHKKKQKGKGFITDLLKTGAKQALRAAAQTGLHVLDNKRSLKEAIKTHVLRAIKSTAQPLLARGGPKKRPRPVKNPKKASIKRPIKRHMKNAPIITRPRSRPLQKAPIKKAPIKKPLRPAPKRALDIFD